MPSAAAHAASARMRVGRLLGRHNRLVWSALFALLVVALYLHAQSFRREAIQDLAANLDLGLDVTQADIDSWRSSRRAHAALLARVVGETRTTAAYDGLVRALMAEEGYEGVWIYNAAGIPITAQASAASAASPPELPADTTPLAQPRTHFVPQAGVYLDFAVPIHAGSRYIGTAILRVAPNDTTFPNLNPTRLSNRTARTTLIARTGDSVRVIATRSHSANAALPRAFALASVPPHVRAALTGQRSRGAGTGLFGSQVGYAARPALATNWALVREMDTQEFEDLLRVPIIVQAVVFGSLAVLVAFLVANRSRAATARRERELARLRTEFVASASHELRTPLAQIRMFSELLRSGGLRTAEDTDRALSVIEKESVRLSALVDNLLSFAQLRRNMEGASEASDIAEEARQVIADFEPLVRARCVTVVAQLEPAVDARVDGRAFRQVLINFLDNALKYGPAGQVITVSVRAVGAQRQLAVEDQGPGIPPDERAKIWQAFYRSADAVASRENGSGIGLAVVRDLVLQSGGTVRVESGAAGGARFVAEFPKVERGWASVRTVRPT
jgi:signal transduction histidine kinase